HTDEPALFSGDTLFNAGAGNVHNGGNVNELFATFVNQLANLPDNTRVYPGHDYIENNLRFTLAREPSNAEAQAMLPQVAGHDPATSAVTTLADEKRINTFMRLDSRGVIDRLRADYPELAAQPDARTVFTRLRELRNKW
ncbi:MAG TPA: hydroxyacylglutathione hydrolase C-terminal domain-containing protein, partial [Rudaea sp.]|nr:hydroxyacylglutathione hydrolase C-terminal domain-containing protein [Rudaea sp.]